VVFLRVVVAPRAKLEAASVGGLAIAALSRFQSFPHIPTKLLPPAVLDTDPGARRVLARGANRLLATYRCELFGFLVQVKAARFWLASNASNISTRRTP
jgi:hypothetical protein